MTARRGRELLQALGGVALLAYVVHRVGVDAALGAFRSLWWPGLLAAAALLVLDQLVRVLSWCTLLRAAGVPVRFGEILFGFLAGTFFGSVLPSSLGTDMARVVMVSRRPGVPIHAAASSMVVLNLFGLLAVSLVGLVSSVVLLVRGEAMVVTDAVIVFALVYVAVLGMLLEGRLPALGLARIPFGERIRGRLQEWLLSLQEAHDARTLWRVFGFALVNQALVMLVQYATAVALELPIPLWLFVVLTPIIAVARLIPLSIEGFGIQQGLYVYLFAHFGVPAPQALAVSLLFAAVNLGFSLGCGVLYAGAKLRWAVAAPTPVVVRSAESDEQC